MPKNISDGNLLTSLQIIDAAIELEPLSEQKVTGVVAHITTGSTHLGPPRDTASVQAATVRNRAARGRFAVAASTVTLLAALTTGLIVTQFDKDSSSLGQGPSASFTTSAPTPGPHPTRSLAPAPLTLLSAYVPSDGLAVDCALITDDGSIDRLRESDVAFRGVVLSVENKMITLRVEHDFRGANSDLIQVVDSLAGEHVSIDALKPQVGQHYLISANGSTINVCGFSGPATSTLEGIYQEAFSKGS